MKDDQIKNLDGKTINLPNQYRHLINEDFVQATEKRFGHITKRCVLYRGKTYTEENGIEYKNVEEYLCELGRG